MISGNFWIPTVRIRINHHYFRNWTLPEKQYIRNSGSGKNYPDLNGKIKLWVIYTGAVLLPKLSAASLTKYSKKSTIAPSSKHRVFTKINWRIVRQIYAYVISG